MSNILLNLCPYAHTRAETSKVSQKTQTTQPEPKTLSSLTQQSDAVINNSLAKEKETTSIKQNTIKLELWQDVAAYLVFMAYSIYGALSTMKFQSPNK